MSERILVVNMNYLGDALMTTPALRALRHSHPDSRIDTIAGSSGGYGAAEILAMDPDIDEVIPRAPGGSTARCVQLAQTLRRGGYDSVVILPSIPAYNTTARLAGTPTRLTTPQLAGRIHLADHLVQAVQPLTGNTPKPKQLVLKVPPAAAETAADMMRSLRPNGAPVIAINLGATRPQKRWPRDHFVTLSSRLVRDYSVVLLGGAVASDLESAEEIRHRVGDSVLLDLTGKTSIAELAGVVAACDAMVTADTGAMHIGSAVGTPLVALFGSTDPEVTGPYGDTPSRVIYKALACAPCGKHPTCNGRYDCLQSITPEEVLLAVQELLPRPGTVALPIAASS